MNNLTQGNITLGKVLETVQQLKASAPPRFEVWVTDVMPARDEEGKPVIMRVDVNEIDPTLETINNSDFVYFMHPVTWMTYEYQLRTENPEPNPLLPLGNIPVYDDEFRTAYWKRKRIRKVLESGRCPDCGNDECVTNGVSLQCSSCNAGYWLDGESHRTMLATDKLDGGNDD